MSGLSELSSSATSEPARHRGEAAPGPAAGPRPDPRAATPVTVLFSGGSDSTLTASLLAEAHSHVHLLTFRHAAMRFEEKCLASVARLRRTHGSDRFTHHFFDINPLLREIFVRPLAADLKRYGTYAVPMCCGACKLAMHVFTIGYNRAHGIPAAADGSNVELAALFPEQMPAVLERYRGLYERYGIRYENPVFRVNRSDHRLFERGVTERREFKNQHLFYSNQHSCLAGILLYGYTLGVRLPLLAQSADPALAEAYVAGKIETFCVPYLDREVGHAVLRAD